MVFLFPSIICFTNNQRNGAILFINNCKSERFENPSLLQLSVMYESKFIFRQQTFQQNPFFPRYFPYQVSFSIIWHILKHNFQFSSVMCQIIVYRNHISFVKEIPFRFSVRDTFIPIRFSGPGRTYHIIRCISS